MIMKCYGDLHVHTTASDGTLTPEQILSRAQEKNLKYLSIADHDTFLGVERLLKSKELSQGKVTLIPAIEISTDLEEEELHILGYFPSIGNGKMAQAINELHQLRERRIERIVAKLSELGCPILLENVYSHSEEGTVGRPHIAREMVAKGYVSNISEAFEKFLARGRPAYVKREKLTPQMAIQLITQGGGIPIWAHPGITRNPVTSFQHLYQHGIKGIELYHPYHSVHFEIMWRNVAEEFQLIITGGSDFHDFEEPPVDVGLRGISCSQINKLLEKIGPMD